ncbi:MAG: 30S ribosomal protein S13 [Parcubacteria group bacterium]|nr:30S ribosomal protein S13 [Parcubacteria group bacterium]
MRIIGINIPDNKRIEAALTYLYGIGRASAADILKAAGVNVDKRAKDLTPEEVNKIRTVIEKNYKIEGELRQIVRQNISRLKEIQSYRGSRHMRHLPVRGQRTRTNSRTVRGNVRKTAGSGKRKVELK